MPGRSFVPGMSFFTMDAQVECIPCIVRQALATCACITQDSSEQERILRHVLGVYSMRPLCGSPAHYSQALYDEIAAFTGIKDPYAEKKDECNQRAQRMIPTCRAELNASSDPLETALRLAAAGNIIDLGIGAHLDMQTTLDTAIHTSFAIDDTHTLRTDLARAHTLLYIGDNTGECVFDMLCIETLKQLYPALDITFVVKAGPIINDATYEDAVAVGITDICTVIDTGCSCIGAPLDAVGPTFSSAFQAADVVIAKGHGNCETLYGTPKESLYFILKAKCDLVARALGVRCGDSVLRKNPLPAS